MNKLGIYVSAQATSFWKNLLPITDNLDEIFRLNHHSIPHINSRVKSHEARAKTHVRMAVNTKSSMSFLRVLPYRARKWSRARRGGAWTCTRCWLGTTDVNTARLASCTPPLPRRTASGIGMLRRMLHLKKILVLYLRIFKYRDNLAVDEKTYQQELRGRHTAALETVDRLDIRPIPH